MKSTPIIAAACFLALTSAVAAEGKRIATEAEFRSLVADRALTSDDANFRNLGNGSIVGEFRGRALTGTWNWVGDTYCRTATWGSRNLGYNCQAVFVDGDRVTFVRDEGRGRENSYRIVK